MSDYCNCCSSNVEHIAQHYDPDGITKAGENAEELLSLFRQCFPGEDVPLTLDDVQNYIDAQEGRA